MRIVITGGCGFLGRRVAPSLLERRDVDKLVLFDNSPSALPLPDDKRIALLTGDIADPVAVQAAIPSRTDAVYHLAAVVIREPLAGKDAVCPVSPDTVMALASPRRVVAGLVHALDLPADAFGDTRSLQLPGFSVAIGEMVEAVRRLGGEAAHARIRWQPDPLVQQIVSGWPPSLSAPRARALGFTADPDIDAVVRAFIEDDLEAQRAQT